LQFAKKRGSSFAIKPMENDKDEIMTKYERLALEMVTGLMGAVAALTAANGAKSEMMSLHLPNLTPEEREELEDDLKVQMENAQQLRENVQSLKLILEQNS
jgi:predicted aconitase